MADIAIFRINYKSDFILTLQSDAGWLIPFCIKFWTGAPSKAYYAYYDGMNYTNCAPVEGEPTKLMVQFDDHHLPIGDLKFQIGYHFTVDDFPTSVEDEVLNQASVIIEVDDAPAQVMLDLNGETAPEIEFSLPAYTNEQQRIANEEQRIAAESIRIVNEESRIAAETTRQHNEAQRISNEESRVAEFARLKQESETATADANAAATLANEKAALAADKAALAQAAATLANDKAQLAADKAALAQAAATLANDKADLAQQKAAYAQAQGDYAKAQGDTAQADHVRAESDHTRAESDHAAYVDSLGAFDISSYHAIDGVLAKYADLAAALGTNGANIPDTLRKGGMSVKFVQSSDNKYVQFRYMSSSTAVADFTKVANWQGVDDEPTAESDNLVKSGGVYERFRNTVNSYDASSANLDFSDERGNVLIRASEGHIKTKNFDSSKDATEIERGLMASSDKFKLNNIEEGAEANDVKAEAKEPEYLSDLEISDEEDNAIVRFIDGHIKTKNFDSSEVSKSNEVIQKIPISENYFDYNVAKTMDKTLLRTIIESSSNGQCTVIWDDFDLPNLMYEIPIKSIGQLDNRFGNYSTPHPAFVVNGVRKQSIYIAVFMSSWVDGHPVSWFGLSPTASKTYLTCKNNSAAKGEGWHLETIYERNLLSYLYRNTHGDTDVRGNTYWGLCRQTENRAESVKLLRGVLPGPSSDNIGEAVNGERWINGTQPSSWSHTLDKWGITDIVGGFHEWCDLCKIVDGQIILADDNNFNSDENAWSDTGVYFGYISNSLYVDTVGHYDVDIKEAMWNEINVANNYDSLADSLRKKMGMLMLVPKLLSTDNSTLFGFTKGKVNYRVTAGETYYPMIGGAMEYNCDLSSSYFSYRANTDDAHHNNMGSRLVFIK